MPYSSLRWQDGGVSMPIHPLTGIVIHEVPGSVCRKRSPCATRSSRSRQARRPTRTSRRFHGPLIFGTIHVQLHEAIIKLRVRHVCAADRITKRMKLTVPPVRLHRTAAPNIHVNGNAVHARSGRQSHASATLRTDFWRLFRVGQPQRPVSRFPSRRSRCRPLRWTRHAPVEIAPLVTNST